MRDIIVLVAALAVGLTLGLSGGALGETEGSEDRSCPSHNPSCR